MRILDCKNHKCNEITKNAVVEAFNHSRKIDTDLVNSQETRRILDRIGGFELSKFVRRVARGVSAGRVQSPTLKLIVDREREREAFVSVDLLLLPYCPYFFVYGKQS